VKHAGPETLAALSALLNKVREDASLVERTPGCFYRKSKACLHFHEDVTGIFADIKLGAAGFTRVRVSTPQEQAELLRLIGAQAASSSTSAPRRRTEA